MRLGNLNIKNGLLAYDTETTGIHPYGSFKKWGFFPARPFAFSFSDTEGNTGYVRWKVNPFTRKVIPEKKTFKAIEELLSDPNITKIGHNIGFDIRMSKFSGFNFKGEVHDTLILAHVFTGGDELKYGLKELGVKFLNFSKYDEDKLIESARQIRKKGKKLGWCIATKELHGKDPVKADYWLADYKLCEHYARQDAERTMLLYLGWYEKVMADENMRQVYIREMKLFHVVKKMEDMGIHVFPSDLNRLRKFYTTYRIKQKILANTHGGKGMNYRSPKQKSKIFYDERKYKPIYFTTKTKNPSTNGDSLKYFAETYKDKLAKAILEYNGASHMISAFLNPYDRLRTYEKIEDGWVLHPNFRQCGPVTGRFSCGDPNLMQVASPTTGRRRTEITLRPREAFGPRKGYVWYLPDYSQIEVWVFSFLAQEKSMMEALLAGKDFHGAVAEQIWGTRPSFKNDKKHFRKRAKLLMFCKLYGGGVGKVAYLTDSSYLEARQFVDDFNGKLPGVQRFMDRMINRVEREGKIISPFGRTYFINPNFSYKAVNYLVQGTSADILKESMINIENLFKRKWTGCHLLLTLHDELIIEVPKKYHSKKLMREIIYEMQKDSSKINCPVPLPVGMKISTRRWSDTQEIESLLNEWKETYLCK